MKNVDDQSRSLTTKKGIPRMGKGVSDLICCEITVCMMPWNFSVGLKSDAPPPLCNELSFIKSHIFEVVVF